MRVVLLQDTPMAVIWLTYGGNGQCLLHAVK